MKNVFTNNHFYPQNFFVKKSENTDIESMLKEISEKAFTISPSSFDAETKYFIFKLRYQPPYIKIPEFREIKNLQIEAISKTRFKNEYNGYIGIDISEWVEHSTKNTLSTAFARFAKCHHIGNMCFLSILTKTILLLKTC